MAMLKARACRSLWGDCGAFWGPVGETVASKEEREELLVRVSSVERRQCKCGQDEGSRSAWLFWLGKENRVRRMVWELTYWALGFRSGRWGHTSLPNSPITEVPCFILWSGIPQQWRICFLQSSNVIFTFLHETMSPFLAGSTSASWFSLSF